MISNVEQTSGPSNPLEHHAVAIHLFMEQQMQKLLPSKLFTIVRLKHKGAMAKAIKWMADNGIVIHQSAVGLRIVKDGEPYAELRFDAQETS